MSLIVSEVYDALIEAGASEAKAKAAAGAIPLAEHLATKDALAEVRADLKDDIAGVRTELAEVRADLKDDIAGVRTELTEVKAELKDDIAGVRTELTEVKAELKDDIAGVRTELAGVKADLKEDIAGLETRLYRHLWVMAVGIVGLIVTLMKLLD